MSSRLLLLPLGLILAAGSLIFIGSVEDSLAANFAIWLFWGSIGSLILTMESFSGQSPRHLLSSFWVVYSLHIFVTTALNLLLKNTAVWPWWEFGDNGGDEYGFWLVSAPLVSAWQDWTIFSKETVDYVSHFDNYALWILLVSFTRSISNYLGGETVYNTKILLCMASALLVSYVYMMALRLYNKRVALVASSLAFWLPDYWFFSAVLMRDILVSCLMVIIYYQVVVSVIGRFNRSRLFVAVVLNFGVMRYLRTDLALINAAVVVFLLLWSDWGSLKGLTRRIIVVGTLISGILGALYIWAPASYQSEVLDRYINGSRVENQMSLNLAEASSDSFGAILLKFPLFIRLPLVCIFLILTPIPPWAAFQGGVGMFPLKAYIYTISGFVWYGMVAFFPVGLVKCLSKTSRSSMWVWVPLIVLVLALSLAGGVQPRWRLMFMPFLLIIIAQGILGWRQYLSLYTMTIFSLIVGIATYCVLKYT